MRSRATLVLVITILVVILDQASKIWIKTHFYLGEDVKIFSWFYLYFIENNGMAFGMELGSKLALTLFRIVAVGFLIWYVVKIYALRTIPRGYLVCLAFIIAGAAGNIFDCVFYGLIFDNPAPPQVASLFLPAEATPRFSSDVWSTCSIFLFSVSSGLHGYHLSADSNSFSFSRFSTLPMQPFRVE